MASIAKRPGDRWRARYRDEAGKEHAKHFDRKVDAQQWLNQVTASVVTGQYVDPKAGRITFEAFYKLWSERQVWAPGTRRRWISLPDPPPSPRFPFERSEGRMSRNG